MKFLKPFSWFLLVAVAIGLLTFAITFTLQAVSAPVSFEMPLAISLIAFVLALVGGAFVGLPALYLARRWGIDQSSWGLALFGGLAGMFAGAIVCFAFFEGYLEIVIPALPVFVTSSAIAGVVAGWLWWILRREFSRSQPVE